MGANELLGEGRWMAARLWAGVGDPGLGVLLHGPRHSGLLYGPRPSGLQVILGFDAPRKQIGVQESRTTPAPRRGYLSRSSSRTTPAPRRGSLSRLPSCLGAFRDIIMNAFFLLKNRGRLYSKINSGLVVGGRPLYCSQGLLEVPKPSVNLVGHLSSHVKIGQKQRDEQKKAVATSHCSQPNTIEYDLALDWMLLREKQDQSFRILHKKHREARKGFASLGSKRSKAEK